MLLNNKTHLPLPIGLAAWLFCLGYVIAQVSFDIDPKPRAIQSCALTTSP